MKKLLFIFVILIACEAQGQPYIPLNIDTSCYWVSSFGFSDSGYFVFGEHTAVPTGTILISGKTYSEIISYPSISPGYNDPMFLFLYKYPINQYLREDTNTKRVYSYKFSDSTERVLLDFSLQPGDTLHQQYESYVIDSIVYRYILGVTRRCQFGHAVYGLGSPFISIEGIGANINFPISAYSEWNYPVYTLFCYSKNGVQLYGDTTTSCLKKPIYTAVNEVVAQQAGYIYADRKLRLMNPLHHKVQVQVYSLDGKHLVAQAFNTESYMMPLNDLPAGIYIVRLQDNKYCNTGKIMVE